MNRRSYRLIWSKRVRMLVAVAETHVSRAIGGGQVRGQRAKAPSDSDADDSDPTRMMASRRLAVIMGLLLSVTLPRLASAAGALPTGGSVTSGSGVVSVGGNTMTVNQASAILGMNWQSFSIGAGNKVIFNQPSATAVAVNKVMGNDASQIYGSLQANGRVFLLNPNGIVFGPNSQVNVGSLLASTASNITQDSKGNWVLNNPSGQAVINQGQLRAQDGGFVVLAANQVTNSGTVQANGGGVALVSGQTVALSLDSGGLLNVQVNGSLLQSLVNNQGLILADGGAVYLTASGRDTLLSTIVNNSGVISARTLGSQAGRVLLMGTGGDVVSSGAIDVSGGQAGQAGGTAILSGDRVGLFDKASINASGVAGGGTVIVGGDKLRMVSNIATVPVANATVIGQNVTIDIGSSQGNGGYLETSGKTLTMLGNVSGHATGKAGQWLIDPNDVVIDSNATSAPNVSNTFGNASTGGTVNNVAISNALAQGTNVTVTTVGGGGNITVNADIAPVIGSSATQTTLSLQADQNITVNNNITSSTVVMVAGMPVSVPGNRLDVVLNAGQNTSLGGVVKVANSSTLDLNGGNITIYGNGNVSGAQGVGIYGRILNVSGGNITGYSNGSSAAAVAFDGATLNQTGNGTLTINGTGLNSSGIFLTNGSAIVQSGNGTLNVSGNSTNAQAILGGTFTQSGNGTLTVVGNSINSDGVNGVTFNQTSTGVMTITGNTTSNSSPSGIFYSTVTQSGNGTLTVSGNANSGTGSGIHSGTVTQSGDGTLTVVGNTTRMRGVASTGVNQSGNGTLTITGNSVDYFGVDSVTATQSGDGILTVAGHSINSPGTYGSILSQSGNGTLNHVGTSTNAAGVWGGWLIQSGNGAINVKGVSDAGQGVEFAGSRWNFSSSGGSVNINATSNTGDGVLWYGNITSNYGGNLSIYASTNNASAQAFNVGSNANSITQTGNGAITLGSNRDFTLGLNITTNGSLNVGSTNGSVNLTGNNAIAGNLNISTPNGNATVNTVGNTTLGNVSTGGNLTIGTTNGSLNVSGNVGSTGNTNLSASGNLSGTGNLTVGGNGQLNSGNGSVNLTGNNAIAGNLNVSAPNGTVTVSTVPYQRQNISAPSPVATGHGTQLGDSNFTFSTSSATYRVNTNANQFAITDGGGKTTVIGVPFNEIVPTGRSAVSDLMLEIQDSGLMSGKERSSVNTTLSQPDRLSTVDSPVADVPLFGDNKGSFK